MRADDIHSLFLLIINITIMILHTGEIPQMDELRDRPLRNVENPKDTGPMAFTTVIGAYAEKPFFFIGGIDVDGLPDGVWAEDNSLFLDGLRGHLLDEVEVMFARFVGDVDWSAGDTPSSGVERTIVMGGLEHVPVWKDIQMLCQEGIMGIAENMPGMTGFNVGEEVIAVADHESGFVGGELGMEEDLRGLRHAGDGFDGEVAEAGDCPGILVGSDETAAVVCVVEEVEEELGVGFDAVDAGGEEEAVEVIVHPGSVFCVDYGHLTFDKSFRFADLAGFVLFCNGSGRGDAAPVAQNRMPYGDVLDVGMVITDVNHGLLEAARKAFLVSLEICPSTLELGVTMVVEGLPIVIDDEIGDGYFILFQDVECVENLLFCQVLSKSIPCAVR